MASTPPVVEAHGLRKEYDGRAAVDGIDLTIHRGEVFALLGPNGAGKSTAAGILAGFRGRDAGEATVLGADPARAGRRWRSRIGIVWQQETEVPRLTVRAVVRHFAGYYPHPRDVDEVLGLAGLTERADALAHTLSGGQRRRLDVALGIVGRPELLFLDEPTTGFDPRARRDFWRTVRDLAAVGTTVVLTTHYLEEVEALADRVCVIAHGRVRAEGPTDSLGGRMTGQTTVSWLADGEPRSVDTDEPTRVVRRLSDAFRGEVPGLTVHRPTLEDVYLNLIDDSPRETEPKEVAA
ncbi:ABC transporter [Nocardiopsis sp. CNR-923]|uniref:ABC transporter ATP-binding protein n=1 Tax=Nocardiopsis sp. CNR-923 TaxID=1904965 RepID=UPI000963E88E|nr:ABC transporter ATP-binding protein [Nocardiopsis sp. CNR-923]OLT26690.1 ABC transporter [Nocardiopsis sp. CNR-923]